MSFTEPVCTINVLDDVATDSVNSAQNILEGTCMESGSPPIWTSPTTPTPYTAFVIDYCEVRTVAAFRLRHNTDDQSRLG